MLQMLRTLPSRGMVHVLSLADMAAQIACCVICVIALVCALLSVLAFTSFAYAPKRASRICFAVNAGIQYRKSILEYARITALPQRLIRDVLAVLYSTERMYGQMYGHRENVILTQRTLSLPDKYQPEITYGPLTDCQFPVSTPQSPQNQRSYIQRMLLYGTIIH